jgi:hypothetical protein
MRSEDNVEYKLICDIVNNQGSYRKMRVLLVLLSTITAISLLYFSDMPIFGVILFSGFFLLPIFFSGVEKRARSAKRAFENGKVKKVNIIIEEFDSEDFPECVIKNGKDFLCRIRMSTTNGKKFEEYQKNIPYGVQAYFDPENDKIAMILLGNKVIWNFRVVNDVKR